VRWGKKGEKPGVDTAQLVKDLEEHGHTDGAADLHRMLTEGPY
jgi:hypothetical protein